MIRGIWALLCLLTAIIFPSPNLFPQTSSSNDQALLQDMAEYQLAEADFKSKLSLLMMMESAGPQEVDVQQYTLAIEFFPATYSIIGEVTINAETLAVSLDTLAIDCHNTLTVDSLLFDGSPKTYTHANDKITLSFDPPLPASQTFTVNITYHGTFTPNQDNGLIFATHGDDNVPVISSLSETYMAPSWWPCIDNPNDKSPVELYLTCPTEIDGNQMVAFSNGSLTSTTDNGNGTTTFHWSETYPIATYLVMVAISNYIEITSLPDTYNTMPLTYYCYPEHLALAEYQFAQVYDLMELYSSRLGEYPFIDEKHASIEIPMASNGMEHQTITCVNDEKMGRPIGAFPMRVIVAHEVSHQWFGDYVTMETWHDIWLNEGLATFFQFYYREAFGEISAVIEKLSIFDTDRFGDSYVYPIYVRDISDPFANSGAIYFKGAWVIHMLREMIDDDTAFFSILASYLANHPYGNAETADFRSAFETGMSIPMNYFFDQWIYTPYWPVYSVIYENSTREGGYKVDINLQQLQEHDVVDIDETPLRDYYIMPVTFTVHYTDDTTETFTVTNDQRSQSFQLLTTKEPDYTVFDESMDILREVQSEEGSDDDGVFIDGDGNGVPGDNPCAGTTGNCDDNCFDIPNGPDVGTCVKNISGMLLGTGIVCTDDVDCSMGEICDTFQGDHDGNGIGDACECYSDINCDAKVNLSDLMILKDEFNQPCPPSPCSADITGDGNVNLSDLVIMKVQFMRSGCPECI